MTQIPPPPQPPRIRVRCHCNETLFWAPRCLRPGVIYERKLSAASRPVTGYSVDLVEGQFVDLAEVLDGDDTVDIWLDDATGWRSRCPGCGTLRMLPATELRQLVIDTGPVVPYIKLPPPS